MAKEKSTNTATLTLRKSPSLYLVDRDPEAEESEQGQSCPIEKRRLSPAPRPVLTQFAPAQGQLKLH